MLGVFLALPIIALLLILPGFWWADRRLRQPRSLLALPFAGAFGWIALVWFGVLPKTLSNIVELFAIAVLAVLACYAKFWILDRKTGTGSKSIYIVWTSYLVASVLIFLLTPALPE
jgi:hypothetical protein